MGSITLRAARVNVGLSLMEASEMLEVNKDTLSRWERGLAYPNVPQIKKIEEVYKLDFNNINFLLDSDSVKPYIGK